MKPLEYFYSNPVNRGKGTPHLFERGFNRVVAVVFAPAFRCKVRGVKKIRDLDEGLILAGNHRSYLDPVFVRQAMRPRTVRFIAKEEFFRIKVIRRLAAWAGAFPIKRDTADFKAIKRSVAMLKRGEVIGIFPEGTRGKGNEKLESTGADRNLESARAVDGLKSIDMGKGKIESSKEVSLKDSLEGKPEETRRALHVSTDISSNVYEDAERESREGVALIANLAKARVVPFRLWNTEKISPEGSRRWHFPTIELSFGEPMSLDDPAYASLEKSEKLQRFTADLMAAIYALPRPE